MSNYERSFLRAAFATAGVTTKIYRPGPQVEYHRIGPPLREELVAKPARVLHSRIPYGHYGYMKFLETVQDQNMRIVRKDTYQTSRAALINRRLRRGRGAGWSRLGLAVPEHRKPEHQWRKK